MADIVRAVAAGRGVAFWTAEGGFALGASVSGPFCPQPESIKPTVINAAIATGPYPRRTKLSDCSDIN